ncbi:MAG: signal peptide peptidase SppA [Candidatus Marinarcus sp.]|uniref:signal peptide peptidase SppA n=1 Tax=Candidatus Marinarcus sp. TaxID=3100987 RepID=UPI003AFF9708
MFEFFKILFLPITKTLDFITKYFKTIVFITIVIFLTTGDESKDSQVANVQKIDLTGPILDVQKTLEEIEKASSSKNIKGILFNVNSPGGSVAPSVELAYAIKELRAKKPVVAYASGIMASGSYYASIWANKIVANPGSMVGSIGVIFQGANIEELMQKIGIKTQTIKIGKYKEAGTFSREWKDYEKAELESVINDTYDMFITDVANARNLDVKNHETYANAHIFTARQAKEVGLVDEVATLNYAQNELYKLANIDKPIWTKKDKMDEFLDKVMSEAVSNFSMSLVSGLKAY